MCCILLYIFDEDNIFEGMAEEYERFYLRPWGLGDATNAVEAVLQEPDELVH